MMRQAVKWALVLLGAALLISYVVLDNLYLSVAGTLLLVVAAMFWPPKSLAMAALSLGIVAVGTSLAAAGGWGDFSTTELLWACAAIVVWPVGLVALAWSFRFRKALYGLLVLPTAAVLALFLAGVHNTIGDIRTLSQYVTMRDGVKIAVSVYTPRRMDSTEGLPTILLQTPYHRATDFRFPWNLLKPPPSGPSPNTKPLVRAGYAYVTVDVRGTGASFGHRETLFSADEVQDGVKIVDWIVAQSWSNGVVGVEGVSYNGTAAEHLLAQRHPAVKAALLQFSLYDAYAEIIFPGGIFADNFVRTWADYAYHLDRNQLGALLGPQYDKFFTGVWPVDGPLGKADLRAAVAEHEKNFDPYATLKSVTFKDDQAGAFSPLAMSTYPLQDRIRTSGVPIFSVSGWLDGAYPYAAIKRFMTTATPGSKLMIGPWDHGGRQNISPCKTGAGGTFDSAALARQFFDYTLKGLKTAYADLPPVSYFTQCAEQWRQDVQWPPAATNADYYLAADGELAGAALDNQQEYDSYTVDPTTSSGIRSRWISYVNTGRVAIGYDDRAQEAQKLLTYTSPILKADMEVTGHPEVTLHMASSESDGQLFVYLEDVAPDGRVTYVTEGQVRLLHHRLSDKTLPYQQPTRYRSFEKADAAAMTPGKVTEVVLDLWPTSYLFRAGHRVRLSIAGADRDNFIKPDTTPTYQVYRGGQTSSRLRLPVVDR